jgi:L-2-hydroxyglutarate oxidase LhgO
MLGDIEHAGGVLALNSPLSHARYAQGAIELIAIDETRLMANTVVNAAGLAAPALARRFEGLQARHVPPTWFAKGSYFSLAGKAPFSRLIYPVPEAAGLGVHLTLDQGGQARFGPDVEWVDDPQDLEVDTERAQAFYSEIRRYWPSLKYGALVPAYAGMRPKIHGPGHAAADFCIQGPQTHGVQGLVNLFGIESPGLTSALAIGEMVAELLRG